jgi:hypothetical protein
MVVVGRMVRRAFGVGLFLFGLIALLSGHAGGAVAMAAVLTGEEYESILNYLYATVEEALESGGRTELREALETVSDVCHPDSILEVDTSDDTVEVSWPEDDEDENKGE